jgi:HK97 family phage major capsid protein
VKFPWRNKQKTVSDTCVPVTDPYAEVESLDADLYKHLVDELYSFPSASRDFNRLKWTMSPEWYAMIHGMKDSHGNRLWEPGPRPALRTIFGYEVVTGPEYGVPELKVFS